ncbi:MAG: tyrosine--tRNA ligase [Alphaproteobacteria bacterium]
MTKRNEFEPRSDFLKVLKEREYLDDCSNPEGLDKLLLEGTVTGYIGFDATAPSLHVGNLMQIMLLRRLQKAGHRPIVLLGGGTTKVGDPSGKDESRKLLTEEQIAANIAGQRIAFEKFLDFGDGETGALWVNNADWLDGLHYIPFLRDIGRHFSVNRMLTFESVRLRLEREQNLSFLEFNYMILQAYDFLELNRNYGCRLQMGGRDQWGNILNGVELGRRADGAALFGLTSPLITTASGAKMGKTAEGAVWLNPDLLSPYDYWQFWRNTEDADVGRFLKLYTELPLDEIARLEKLEGQEINEAKKVLATEATAMLHGRAAAEKAQEAARAAFESGTVSANLPTVEIPEAELTDGVAAFELFKRAGLASSGGEARRLIKGGGARVNDAAVTSDAETISADHLTADGVVKLSAGKKRHVLVKPV